MARRRRTRPTPASICRPGWARSAGSGPRVDELIELLSLEAYRSKFVRELSTGTRRVVDLACVVAHRPSVVLLDEPSSGIAQRESEALGPLLLRIRDMLGAGLVVIEHDMPLLAGLADRLVALDQGSRPGRGIARRRPARPAGHRLVPGRERNGHRTVRRRCGPAARSRLLNGR